MWLTIEEYLDWWETEVRRDLHFCSFQLKPKGKVYVFQEIDREAREAKYTFEPTDWPPRPTPTYKASLDKKVIGLVMPYQIRNFRNNKSSQGDK